jgi:hypothetical protein
MKVTNQDYSREEIKKGLNLASTWYHSVQNLLSFHLLCKNVNLGMSIHTLLLTPQKSELMIHPPYVQSWTGSLWLQPVWSTQRRSERPLFRKWPRRDACLTYHSTKNIFCSLRMYRSLWTAGINALKTTGTIQGVPGGKVNILGGHSISQSKQESVYVHVSYSERFPR